MLLQKIKETLKKFLKKIIKKFQDKVDVPVIVSDTILDSTLNNINTVNQKIKNEKFIEMLEDLSIKNIKKFDDIDINQILDNFERDLREISKEKDLSEIRFILIMDDHYGSLKLLENDLKELLKNHKKNFYIFKLSTEYAPFYLLKFINIFKKYNIKFSLTVLDIIYGGIEIKNNKKIILDGIDIAQKLIEEDLYQGIPNIVFYTGCDLNMNSEEYEKINKLKENFNIHISDKDIIDENRLFAIKQILLNIENSCEVKNEKI